jgi:uncharacterized membrane protein YuzA (DUF378 family)
MRNIILVIAVVWMLIVAGFNLLGLVMGWSVILATIITAILGGCAYWIYRKYLDTY